MHHYLLKNAPIACPSGTTADTLLVQNGMIVPPTDNQHVPQIIDCSGYVLLPGLINAHDHLELNHFPRTKFREHYENAHQWGEDVSQRLDAAPFKALRQKRLRDRCLIGGIKNLLSGVTTVAHHNPLHRPLRQRDYPVQVLQDYLWQHSLHFSDMAQIRSATLRMPTDMPFIIHLAEGVDAVAAAEYQQLMQLGATRQNTIIVHGVGLKAEDHQHAIDHIAGLVWCPSTNHYLLGQTTDVQLWAQSEKLALGSDSRLTADGDLLDEIRAANQTNQLNAQQLFQAVTTWPAYMLRLQNKGTLQVGSHADIVALKTHPAHANAPLQTLLETKRHHVGLVIRAGIPLYGDTVLMQQFRREKFVPIVVDGHPKLLHHRIAHQLKRSSLQETGVVLESS